MSKSRSFVLKLLNFAGLDSIRNKTIPKDPTNPSAGSYTFKCQKEYICTEVRFLYYKTVNFPSKTMNFAFNMMNVVFKMIQALC